MPTSPETVASPVWDALTKQLSAGSAAGLERFYQKSGRSDGMTRDSFLAEIAEAAAADFTKTFILPKVSEAPILPSDFIHVEKQPVGGASKLSEETKQAIRESSELAPTLAKRYGVGVTTVRRVRQSDPAVLQQQILHAALVGQMDVEAVAVRYDVPVETVNDVLARYKSVEHDAKLFEGTRMKLPEVVQRDARLIIPEEKRLAVLNTYTPGMRLAEVAMACAVPRTSVRKILVDAGRYVSTPIRKSPEVEQKVLSLLRDEPTLAVYAVAQRIQISPSTVSRILDEAPPELQQARKEAFASKEAAKAAKREERLLGRQECENRRSAIVAAYEPGKTLKELAKQFGVCRHTIKHILGDRYQRVRPTSSLKTPPEVEQQVRELCQQGFRRRDIEAKVGLSKPTIYRILRELPAGSEAQHATANA